MASTRTWNGALLRKYRKSRGLTQEELARLLPTSTVNIWRWENGKNTPSANLLALLSDRLGVSLDEFYENGKEAEVCR